jgi:aspartate racemase
MSNLKVGILGGMGPRATVEFEKRLLDRLQGSDQDLPQIITINNGQVPDRSQFLISDGSDPLPALIEGARILQQARVHVVCVPCNTAHSSKILARLLAEVPLPIIDMPASCLIAAEKQGLKRVLILGTRGTCESNIFGSRAVSLDCVYPPKRLQQQIELAIGAIKSNLAAPTSLIQDINAFAKVSEIDGLILACTELSLLQRQEFDSSLLILDSLDVLAERCAQTVSEYNNDKGEI